MGFVVSLLNQKGGVGKTSTCHHVSGALAGVGRRVLLVDNDPQASLTQGFFLGRQSSLDEALLQFLKVGRRIAAEPPPQRPHHLPLLQRFA